MDLYSSQITNTFGGVNKQTFILKTTNVMSEIENKQMVYQAIKSIADNLCKEDKTYLRADLAFELKKYGIASDSSEVSKLVFDAYRFFITMAISPSPLYRTTPAQRLWLSIS